MRLRSIGKRAVLGACRFAGLNAALRWASRGRLLILGYHGVIPDEYLKQPWDNSDVGLREFRQHLEIICRFFRPVSPSEVAQWAAGGTSLPDRSILLTFDDGYRNNFLYAAPELERLGVPALFSLATGYIGSQRLLWTRQLRAQILRWPCRGFPMPNGQPDIELPAGHDARLHIAGRLVSLCKRLEDGVRRQYLDRLANQFTPQAASTDHELLGFLSWEEARQLHRRGFAIGSHTVTHPILTTTSLEDADREIRVSKAVIEHEVGSRCVWFTYPNGTVEDICPCVVRLVQEAGYQVAFTLMDYLNDQHGCPFQLHRRCVAGRNEKDTFEALTGGALACLHGRNPLRRGKIAPPSRGHCVHRVMLAMAQCHERVAN